MATFDINDVARRVQYTSTGQTGPFNFTFQVNASSELLVYIDDTVKTETTHYTVSLNADGTGSVTFTTATTSGELITIIGDQPLSRTTVFQVGQVNQPTTLETEFDNTLIRQQQIKEITDRSIQLKPSTGRTVTGSGTSGPLYFPYDTTVANNANRVLKYDSAGTSLELGSTTTNIDALAAIASDITTVSGISSNVTTVAGIASNVTSVASNASNINTVATNIANVNTVAGISSNVTTVAGLSTEITALSGVSSADLVAVAALGTELATLAPIASDITTVAGVSGNVTTVAGISSDVSTVSGISANTTTVAGIASNVTTVAGISSDVSTVAGISANVTTVAGDTANIATVAGNTTNINTVATNITDVNTFANRYRIAATDPTTSLDVGDLYYDTTNDIMKVYGSSGWQNAGSSVNGTSARFQYVVTSSTTTLTGTDANGATLLYDPVYVDVYLNGVKMVNGTDVTVTSGTSVVFASPIGTSGTDYVDIIGYGTFNVASISTTSITSGTLGYARGGTGLGTLGSADEVLQMNSGGTALEYGKVQAGNLDVAGNGTSGQMLTSDGDGTFSWADAPSGFSLVALSGSTPTIDWSAGTAFAQTLSADTTYTFSNVPTAGEIELFIKHVGLTNVITIDSTPPSGSFSGLSSSYTHQYSPQSMCFNSDGTKLYAGYYNTSGGYGSVTSASLSTPYDITTASYDGVSGNIGAQYYQDGHPYDISHDDAYLFSADAAPELLVRYDFGTADTVTTIPSSYNQSKSTSSLFTHSSAPTIRGVKFYDNGNKVILAANATLANSNSGDSLRSFSLSSPYDLTSTFTLISSTCVTTAFPSASSETNIFNQLSISADGVGIVWLSSTHVYFGTMTTPFDITTISNTSRVTTGTLQVDANALRVHMATLNNDGSKIIFQEGFGASDSSDKTFYQANTSTDYQLTLPSGVSSKLTSNWGSGPDPATTSYVRIVTIDGGSNYFLLNQSELT